MKAVPLAALAVLLATSLSGCGDYFGGDDSHTVEVHGAHTGFTIEVPEDWGISYVDDTAVCDSVSYTLGQLRLEAVPTSCPDAEQNTEIGNGKHGVYRVLDDVPEPKDVEQLETELGSVEVFEQSYFECTNECDRWDEPVAIVTVDDPVDPAYPTLVVRAHRDQVERSTFEDLVETLAAAYEPGS